MNYEDRQTDGSVALKAVCDSHLPAENRLVWCDSVLDVVAQLGRLDPAELGGLRFIVLVWEHVPQYSKMLDEVIDRLADATQALWPDWYISQPVENFQLMSLESLQHRARMAELDHQHTAR